MTPAELDQIRANATRRWRAFSAPERAQSTFLEEEGYSTTWESRGDRAAERILPVDRDTLYRELTGAPYDGWDRAIDLRVSKLRKKLGDRAHAPAWIKSIRGVGYQLTDPGT